MPQTAFIGLGTNLEDREQNLREAVSKIESAAGTVISCSKVYDTEPWGFKSANRFMNMVIRLETELKASDLLKELLKIEIGMGRFRGTERYSSRIIDIDILLYENEIINKPYLKLPHPLIQDRKFVLVPFCDIAPEAIHPVLNQTFAQLLTECRDETEVKKLNLLPFV